MNLTSSVCRYQCTDIESIKEFSYEIFTSINAVNALQWDRHIPPVNKLMQTDYLQLIEASQKGKMEFKYVIVKNENRAVGVAYFQVVPFTGHDLINYYPQIPESGLKKYVLTLGKYITEALLYSINVKLLVSGNTFMTGENGFYFNHDVSHSQRGAIIRSIVPEIKSTDPKIKAVLISDLYEPKTEFDTNFLPTGYSEITVEQDMAIAIRPNWKTFDDYINDLSSKYRVRAKKVFSLCSESGVSCRDLSSEDLKVLGSRIYELYNMVINKADFKLSTLNADYFYLQKEQMPNNYHIFAYFRNEQMIGFISVFNFGKRAEVHYTGMEHTVTKPLHLYQHMMYDMVKFAIEKNAEKLHFGRTAPEIKSTIGATGSAMYGYLKHNSYLFNKLLMGPFTKRLKPKEYVLRTPFKN